MLVLPAYTSAPTWLEKAKIPTTKQTRKGWSSVRYLGVFLYQSDRVSKVSKDTISWHCHFTLDSVHLSINCCARSVKICHDKWIMLQKHV